MCPEAHLRAGRALNDFRQKVLGRPACNFVLYPLSSSHASAWAAAGEVLRLLIWGIPHPRAALGQAAKKLCDSGPCCLMSIMPSLHLFGLLQSEPKKCTSTFYKTWHVLADLVQRVEAALTRRSMFTCLRTILPSASELLSMLHHDTLTSPVASTT